MIIQEHNTSEMEQINDMNAHQDYIKLVEVCKIEIGISKNQKWIFKRNRDFYEYEGDDDEGIIFWLPLLEIPYKDLLALLEIECNKLNENANAISSILKSFPTNSILRSALESNSEYWVNLAFKWCEDIEDLKKHAEVLINISKDKNYSQNIRHQALKLLRKAK